jgi:hypothetical protein
MVTTPVPPTPVTRIENGRVEAGGSISGRAEKSGVAVVVGRPLRRRPPSMVTKDGQKPFRQEKSLLHEDWSIAR